MLKFKNNQFFFMIALSSIVPFLIWGPFFPDLIVSLTSLFFLFQVIKNNDFRFFNNKPLIIFFVFCFYVIVCSVVSDNIMFSFESSLFYFRIGVFSCLIWYMIDKDKNILLFFYYALTICFSSLVIDGYIQFLFGKNIFGWVLSNENRISSFFGDEWIMGSYLSRLFPLLFALFLIKKKNRFEIYYIGVLFILIDILIYVSGERTAFFFLNLSTLFIIILIKKYQKFRLITFLIALLLITVLTFNNSKLAERMITGPGKTMGFISDDRQNHIFTPAHDSLIKTAFNMFLDKPILGHGPKMFRVICKNKMYQTGIKPCDTHPHNFYAQLLAETGFTGFVFLFLALLYVFYSAYRQFKSIILKQKRYLSDYQVCLLGGLLITVWPFSPNGNFFNNWLMIVYSLPIGFYLHSFYGIKRKQLISC
jgi:O-antigen ligase